MLRFLLDFKMSSSCVRRVVPSTKSISAFALSVKQPVCNITVLRATSIYEKLTSAARWQVWQ